MRAYELYEDDDRDLDKADRWLSEFTYKNLDRWPSKEVQETLKHRYPITEPIEVYRGMNFISKKEYENFIDQIQNGKIHFNSISSWAPTRLEAYQFAVTQPTYFLNRELMQRESEKSRNRELLSGYRGIILKATVNPGQGIDVRKSKFSKESEIILLSGDYKIEIEEIKRFADRIPETNINEFVSSLTKEDLKGDKEESQFLSYILHHHKDQLNDQAKHNLFLIYRDPRFEIDQREDYAYTSSFSEPRTLYWMVFYPRQYYHMAKEGFFTEEDLKVVAQDIKRLLNAVIRHQQQHEGDEYRYVFSLLDLAEMVGERYKAIDFLKKTIGSRYHDLQMKGRDLNKIKDPDEFQRQFRRHQQELERFFNSMK